MAKKLKTLDKWHQTKEGLLAFGAVELLLAYGFASWAIDSGNLWLYLLTVIFLIGALKNIYKLIISVIRNE